MLRKLEREARRIEENGPRFSSGSGPKSEANLMPTPKVVVVGAGYAGLNATLRLADLRNERNEAFDLALIDQHPYHLVKIRLHEAAVRSVDITNPLDEVLAE